MLLNSLGNNLKYSMICTNWYEITHSAQVQLPLWFAASALCQGRFFVTAWKYKYKIAIWIAHL